MITRCFASKYGECADWTGTVEQYETHLRELHVEPQDGVDVDEVIERLTTPGQLLPVPVPEDFSPDAAEWRADQ